MTDYDLTEELYGTLYWGEKGQGTCQPGSLVEHRAYELVEKDEFTIGFNDQWFDIKAATDEYLRQVAAILKPSGAKLSKDGRTANLPSPEHYGKMFDRLLGRAALIDIDGILNSHKDDGWVVDDQWGNVYGPDMWETLLQMMDDEIGEQVSDELAPCTHQEFVDEYTKRYYDKYHEDWEPFSQHPQI